MVGMSPSCAKVFGLWLLVSLVGPWAPALLAEEGSDSPTSEPVRIYFFSSLSCPHCQAQEPFLRELADRHREVVLKRYELSHSREHHALFAEMTQAHGLEGGSVPTVLLGGRGWVGDSPSIRREIEQHLADCLVTSCPDSGSIGHPGESRYRSDTVSIDIPWLGSIDLGIQPLALSTALIAFVDGFNPCSLWVLTILLALVIHSGSRRRVLIVGLTFLSVTAAIYGLFITGVFGVLSYLVYVTWVYWLVALLALLFALVNIKDYFWYKRGLSFTIDERHKPGLFRRMRGLISDGHSIWSLIAATAVMAAGISLIELPCTAGFPVVWSTLVASHEIEWWYFAALLTLYLLIYLAIELIIFLTALISFRVDRFEERHGRLLKLVGGLIMLALALVLLFAPEMMQDVGSTLAVFLFAILVAFLIVVLHRFVLPRLGIRIGDEKH
jgi:cytochrome c biogenesis protein CcdA/thiol-disulfide isomerase/thioredoxin